MFLLTQQYISLGAKQALTNRNHVIVQAARELQQKHAALR